MDVSYVSLLLMVKVSVVVAVVKVWTTWFVPTTQRGLSQAKHPGFFFFFWSAIGLREQRGREHGSKGAAVAFPEDGWVGNGLSKGIVLTVLLMVLTILERPVVGSKDGQCSSIPENESTMLIAMDESAKKRWRSVQKDKKEAMNALCEH